MDDILLLGHKQCIDCKTPKPLSEFTRDRYTSDGHSVYCKQCNQTRRFTCRECKRAFRPEELRRATDRKRYCLPCWEMMQGKKRCIGCKEVKALSDFFEDHRTRDGVGLFCIACETSSKTTQRQEQDTTREFSDVRISGRAVRKFRSLYKISEDDYRNLHEQQKGLCAICARPEMKRMNRLLSVDHDHQTGKVRALLCNACNTGLGAFEDNIDYLSKAVEYLQRHK